MFVTVSVNRTFFLSSSFPILSLLVTPDVLLKQFISAVLTLLYLPLTLPSTENHSLRHRQNQYSLYTTMLVCMEMFWLMYHTELSKYTADVFLYHDDPFRFTLWHFFRYVNSLPCSNLSMLGTVLKSVCTFPMDMTCVFLPLIFDIKSDHRHSRYQLVPGGLLVIQQRGLCRRRISGCWRTFKSGRP